MHKKLLHREKRSSVEISGVIVELVAEISADRLVIVVRKNISGITQRIGDVTLKKDDSHEIDVVSWASTAVARSTSLEDQVRSLSDKLKAHEDGVGKLKMQLEELQQAKKDDEKSLLDKFCEVLNHKKYKIRTQQALLAGAKLDSQRGMLRAVWSACKLLTLDKLPVSKLVSLPELIASRRLLGRGSVRLFS